MSTSNTISNLQQAINCAGKCDCCEKLQSQIDSLKGQVGELKNSISGLEQQISAVNGKTDGLNSRTNNLEDRVRRLENNNPNQGKSVDLTPIYQRLNKIESYINKLDAACNQLVTPIKELGLLLLNTIL